MKNQKNQTQKAIIFDSGALISFSMNGITRILQQLKGVFQGKFLITPEVKREVIDVPMKIKKFELEALKIKELLDDGILELPSALGITSQEIEKADQEFLAIANLTFSGLGKDIHILDHGEASCLGLSKLLTERGIKNLIAIDERTTRLLVEKPENLKRIFEDRMNTRVIINSENARHFSDFKIIRSTELAYVAWKKGLTDLKDGLVVLDALLYALKFKGAAISGEEIEEIKKLK